MDTIKHRRASTLIALAALITALTAGAYGAPVAAAPDEQHAAAKQARAEARAEAKAAREAAKQARAEARAEAKAAREAAKQANAEKVTVCHKPGTPAQGTIEISASALPAHLSHGDVVDACGTPASVTQTTCEEPGTSDPGTSLATETDDDDSACAELEPLIVSIDAPASVESQDVLRLEGAVSGYEADDLRFAWSSSCLTDEQLTDPAIIASEPGTAVLILREDTLLPGSTCDFTLAVVDEVSGAHGSATATVEVLAIP